MSCLLFTNANCLQFICTAHNEIERVYVNRFFNGNNCFCSSTKTAFLRYYCICCFFPLKDSVTKVHEWFRFLVLCTAAVLLGLALNTHCPIVTTKKCSDRKEGKDVRVRTGKKEFQEISLTQERPHLGEIFFFYLNFILRTQKNISLSAKAVSFLQNSGSKFRHNPRQNQSFTCPKIHMSAHALWSLEGCAHHFVVNKKKKKKRQRLGNKHPTTVHYFFSATWPHILCWTKRNCLLRIVLFYTTRVVRL